ncbi:hypothetical protein HK099_001163 [Clydaea vesicula]|uniref:B30.2/SPRY domain-containing protein n=1 Tax=Clydaea vesicula TaxID=447962 RepID=A0AAD5XS78_9FUNG|nr:hypothetical protein HK099_001163 [Clydaea vesicula]
MRQKTIICGGQKELQYIKDIGVQIQMLSEFSKKKQRLTALKDLTELKNLTSLSQKEDNMNLIGMEAIMAIVDRSSRNQILRTKLMARMSDEKELSTSLQQHKEDFSQFICKRRLAGKKELKEIFQAGPGLVCRYGDLISDASIDTIRTFEYSNMVQLVQDGINCSFLELEDVSSLLSRQIFLSNPKKKTLIIVYPSRLEIELIVEYKKEEDDVETEESMMNRESPESVGQISTEIKQKLKAPVPIPYWTCVYACRGVWGKRLLGKFILKDLCSQAVDQFTRDLKNPLKVQLSCTQLVARILDAVHPTHQLQSSVLASGGMGVTVLKKQAISLGYNVSKESLIAAGIISTGEDFLGSTQHCDPKLGLHILKQVLARLETELRYYFEFSAPDIVDWRVGFCSAIQYPNEYLTYPGELPGTMGFGSDGSIFYNGKVKSYIKLEKEEFSVGMKTWGIIVDFKKCCISFVVCGKEQPIAFGKFSLMFNEKERNEQTELIKNCELIPMISMLTKYDVSPYSEKHQMTFNFGPTFNFQSIVATPFNKNVKYKEFDCEDSNIVGNLSEDVKDKTSVEDEEKNFMSIEKTNYKAAVSSFEMKSFSRFPPSIYRRSIACMKIQRAWRRYQGKIIRNTLRALQFNAASIIQNMARKKLRKIKLMKNLAAAKIQKNWRKKKFVWIALLRCIYQQTIFELHKSASLIQRRYRHWKTFKNSPIAQKYNKRIEGQIEKSVNKIIAWWKPLYKKVSEQKRKTEIHQAAINIQRVYRGWYLRQMLRPDLRQKLSALGASVAKHRKELFKIHSAYVLQNAWRAYIQRRILNEKIKTRNSAGSRIQALWRGFWVRSHTHMRFSYGEAVFLSAVCKALRSCHFIPKMYRCCGIVCPKESNN